MILAQSNPKMFADNYTLGGKDGFETILSLVLLHELGHFAINQNVGFEMTTEKTVLHGQLPTEPEDMTSLKKVELRVDSLAVKWVAAVGLNPSAQCSSVCMDIQLLVPSMSFMLAGRRMIDDFGNPNIDFLMDSGFSHPNLELRITFMDYYLNPTPKKKEQIDYYIYKRTVEPIHNQELDPRIFQGQEKRLD